ncbi:unnamed protein product [Rotaria sordida]|uniref:Uncharacterized protein n=1 Tax=Rotaria sordida TaxID=392033 RepID=A0A814YUC3_9BILA|nr:unnamed protein product [Rotaria sordida]
MNNKPANSLYQRYIKLYVAVFKGTKEAAYLKGNKQWNNLKAAGDNENIEKEIHRMTLEPKLKQPQPLFTVWARQSTTSINPVHNSNSMVNLAVTETDTTTTKVNDTNTSSASNSSSSKIFSNRTTTCHAQVQIQKELEDTREELSNIRALKSSKLIEKHPDAAAEYNLAVYDQTGQPSIEDRGQKSLFGS